MTRVLDGPEPDKQGSADREPGTDSSWLEAAEPDLLADGTIKEFLSRYAREV